MAATRPASHVFVAACHACISARNLAAAAESFFAGTVVDVSEAVDELEVSPVLANAVAEYELSMSASTPAEMTLFSFIDVSSM
jgi:hypothetical protein